MTMYCSPEMLEVEADEAEAALERLSAVLGGIQYSNMRHLGYPDVTLAQCIAAQRNALINSANDIAD